jgi:hypothetical protein
LRGATNTIMAAVSVTAVEEVGETGYFSAVERINFDSIRIAINPGQGGANTEKGGEHYQSGVA